MIDEFLASRPTNQHLFLIFTTRSQAKSNDTARRLQKYIDEIDSKNDRKASVLSNRGLIARLFGRVEADVDASRRESNQRIGNALAGTGEVSKSPGSGAGIIPSLKVAAVSQSSRVALHPEHVELTCLASVVELASRLRRLLSRLDVLICNAGTGGVTGIDWWKAARRVPFDFVKELTCPSFKIAAEGWLVGAQRRSAEGGNGNWEVRGKKDDDDDEKETENENKKKKNRSADEEENPPLGMVFASNVFGHYVLGHELAPLMRRQKRTSTTKATTHTLSSNQSPIRNTKRSRIVWISSLEAYSHSLRFDGAQNEDIQALTHPLAYESSKRLTDILVLTSELDSTRAWVQQYFSYETNDNNNSGDCDNGSKKSAHNQPIANSQSPDSHSSDLNPHLPPRLYLAHPGICATSIVTLPFVFLEVLMALALYIARWAGSPWHTADAYTGAGAPVRVALAGGREGGVGEGGCEGFGRAHGHDADDGGHAHADDADDDNDNGNDGDDPSNKVKWGSGTDRWGRLLIRRTDVEGWTGATGSNGGGGDEAGHEGGRRAREETSADGVVNGKVRGLRSQSQSQSQSHFEDLGWHCWREMERLRVDWMDRI